MLAFYFYLFTLGWEKNERVRIHCNADFLPLSRSRDSYAVASAIRVSLETGVSLLSQFSECNWILENAVRTTGIKGGIRLWGNEKQPFEIEILFCHDWTLSLMNSTLTFLTQEKRGPLLRAWLSYQNKSSPLSSHLRCFSATTKNFFVIHPRAECLYWISGICDDDDTAASRNPTKVPRASCHTGFSFSLHNILSVTRRSCSVRKYNVQCKKEGHRTMERS